MFYFNRMARVQYYQHNVTHKDIDHCFDCARSVQILQAYLLRFDGWCTDVERDAATGQRTQEISEEVLVAQVAKQLDEIEEALAKADKVEAQDDAANNSRRGGRAAEEQMSPKSSPVRQGGQEDEDIEYEGIF